MIMWEKHIWPMSGTRGKLSKIYELLVSLQGALGQEPSS